MLSLCAAIGKNRELGKNGAVIWSLRRDVDFYVEQTRDKKLLVGKRTFDGLELYAKGSSLYVLNETPFDAAAQRKTAWGKEHTFVVTDLQKFIEEYKGSAEEVVVIGGAGVFAQTLPFAKKLYLDEIDAEDAAADVFFPEFNKAEWNKVVLETGEDAVSGLKYQLTEYTRRRGEKTAGRAGGFRV
jgi:dihydrofolate reductase